MCSLYSNHPQHRTFKLSSGPLMLRQPGELMIKRCGPTSDYLQIRILVTARVTEKHGQFWKDWKGKKSGNYLGISERTFTFRRFDGQMGPEVKILKSSGKAQCHSWKEPLPTSMRTLRCSPTDTAGAMRSKLVKSANQIWSGYLFECLTVKILHLDLHRANILQFRLFPVKGGYLKLCFKLYFGALGIFAAVDFQDEWNPL